MAYLAFLWGDGSAVDAFLRGLFRSWPSFPEERRSALREALFAELAGQYRRPARDFESNPPPWLNRNIPNPKGYLATKVFKQAEGILGKRKEADELTRRIAQLRDDALTDPERTEYEAWDQAIKKVVAELTGSRIDYTPEPDPGEVISARYDERNQAIEQVAAAGRGVSRERAQTIQRARREQWDLDEVKEAMGGDDPWRATKTTLRNEIKKPASTSAPSRPPVRFQMAKPCPASIRFFAIGTPIAPSPTNPSFIRFLPSALQDSARGARRPTRYSQIEALRAPRAGGRSRRRAGSSSARRAGGGRGPSPPRPPGRSRPSPRRPPAGPGGAVPWGQA